MSITNLLTYSLHYCGKTHLKVGGLGYLHLLVHMAHITVLYSFITYSMTLFCANIIGDRSLLRKVFEKLLEYSKFLEKGYREI